MEVIYSYPLLPKVDGQMIKDNGGHLFLPIVAKWLASEADNDVSLHLYSIWWLLNCISSFSWPW